MLVICGGAVAGSEAARLFAERGALAIVFEQNARPYGKIEDGLPRWHAKLREKEYARIDENLDTLRQSSEPAVRQVAAEGTTILYTTHYMQEAEELCQRLAILDHGRILAEGTVDELKRMVGEGEVVTVRMVIGMIVAVSGTALVTKLVRRHRVVIP